MPRRVDPVQSAPDKVHEAPTLLFDVSLVGFYRWVRRRLELLGIRVILTRYKNDKDIALEAEKLNAIVVTTDKTFQYPYKIVLPMRRPKYETWLTYLLKQLREVGKCD